MNKDLEGRHACVILTMEEGKLITTEAGNRGLLDLYRETPREELRSRDMV